MKILGNGCALAVLALGLVGTASAQIEVKPSPIHMVPADPDAASDNAPHLQMQMTDPPTYKLVGGEQPAVEGPATAPPAPIMSSPTEASPAQSSPAQSSPTLVSGRKGADPTLALTAPAPQPETLDPREAAFFVALGHRVTDAAAAYEGYVRTAAAIDARFADGGSVQAALRVGSNYNPLQLQEGVIAYAAVLALRSQDFVDGVRAQGQPWLADRLITDPNEVMQIRGADEAAMDVAGVLRAQSQALLAAGRLINQASYDVQRQAWSRSPVGEPDKVLASAKASAIRLSAADVNTERALLKSIGAAPMSTASGASPSPEVVRGLALAAVAILGRAGDSGEQRFEPLLREMRTADCLQMSKLNLNQCLAVAGPHYEDVFCLGRHAVSETAQCLVSAADGGAAPVETRVSDTRAAESTSSGPQPYASQAYGPERSDAYGPPAGWQGGQRDLVSR